MDLSHISGGALQAGILALLGTMIGWLFWKRAANQVRNTNAYADRESVFQENLQTRLEAAQARADALESRLRIALDGRAIIERKLTEADRHIVILLDEVERLSSGRRAELERWVKNSRLAGLDDDLPPAPPAPPKRPRR